MMAGDLHYMACTSSSGLHYSSQNVGFGDFTAALGLFNADTTLQFSSMGNDKISNSPFFSSPLDSDLSTGYLQDALVEFSNRFKRRRLSTYPDQDYDQLHGLDDLSMSCWNSDCTSWEFSGELNCMSQTTSSEDFSGELVNRISEETSRALTDSDHMRSPPQAAATITPATSEATESFSSSYIKGSFKNPIFEKSAMHPPAGEQDKRRKKKVAYPFEVVKPGGTQGDVTLNDINERILMRPTRPVRHPVGAYACQPCVPTARGPGLSGKAVVALTRIHTQGRGSITIIRTKG